MSNLANGRVILKFNNFVLMQKNSSSLLYSNFILNLYIIYELHNWPLNTTNNFPQKTCLLVTVKLVRNTVKSKFIYNGWVTTFDGEGLWSFDNDFARNVAIFVVDNSSSFHTNNWTNNFLELDERLPDGFNDSTGAAEKNNINFSKAKTKFCLSLHYDGDKSYLFVNKIKILPI